MSLERQLDLEEQMLSLGDAKYREGLDASDDFDTAHIQKIVKKIIEPFADIVKCAIKQEYDSYVRNKLPLMTLDKKNLYVNKNNKDTTIQPLQISFIVVRSIFMSLREGKHRMVAASASVGKTINSNILAEEQYNESEELRIGSILVNLLVVNFPEWFMTEVNDAGLLTVPLEYFDKESKNKEYVICPTEKFITDCEDMIEGIAEISAVVFPMIHVPVDWNSDGREGGFYSEQLKRNIIKRKTLEEPSGINQDIATSVNMIQSTPWLVNMETFNTMEILNNSKKKPTTYEKAFPHKVPKNPPRQLDKNLKFSDMTDEQKKIHQIWTRQTNKLKKDRQAKISVDLSREASIKQASMFMGESNIYFPHDLDYRNRLYNECMTGLNTQGNDTQKGLIKFGVASAVKTSEGVRWMQINMANLVGHDKLILDDRVNWTKSNDDLLRDVVKDPIKCDLWHKWDKPLQGLAAAIEYVKWLDNDQAVLNTHVQLDGLCNGVQNLAAITRDEKVAPHVGLIWTPERGDVYQYVCDAVIRKIKGIDPLPGDEWLISQWLSSNLMDRKLTKTPVMTRSYGSTLYGIKDGVQDFIDEKRMAEHFNDSFIAGNWMGEQIWEAMGDSLRGPMAFMEWVQNCAGILAKANKPLIWSNPIGGRCIQSPMNTKKKRVEVRIDGRLVKYQIQVPTNTINRSKAESSSSPNVIHSCDASHLMKTSLFCKDMGVTSFAMVHDSFGAIPDEASTLLHCAKEAWIDIYQHNWMEIWYNDWCEQLGKNKTFKNESLVIPPPPPMGTLDITAVRDSDFFFA